ncbi:MAG TPA: 16S rRNA (adenine(1518)-N(6)/adenine(1519)-N(6))-dimethyltransferase RsmA [Candidatus Paceibacterota bacterium]
MQKLGQHFLRNAAINQKIVAALALAKGDHIIEIGPGHGELTVPLARTAQDNHREIVCIEKDHSLIEGLELLAIKERTAAVIKIVEGDALKLLPDLMTAKSKIVGNIPYYITGKLFRIMSEADQRPERAVLLIQKEVAERLCAVPPAMNRLAASVQFWAEPELLAVVPRKDFFPPPEVDSAAIILKNRVATRPSIDPALYYRAVRAIFAQPRKTILNNLSAIAKNDSSKEDIAKTMKAIGVDPGARPQDLDIDAIIAIAKAPLWG